MSAIGPKRTSLVAPHMSALEGKADMAVCERSAFAVAIGGKADMSLCAAHVRVAAVRARHSHKARRRLGPDTEIERARARTGSSARLASQGRCPQAATLPPPRRVRGSRA